MKAYNNLVEATNDLMKRGYTANLSLEGDTIDDKDKGIHMTADDFEIDEFYRFGQVSPFSCGMENYVCNTPVLNSFTSGFSAAASRAHSRASRVCAGSMMASTHRRAAA